MIFRLYINEYAKSVWVRFDRAITIQSFNLDDIDINNPILRDTKQMILDNARKEGKGAGVERERKTTTSREHKVRDREINIDR